MRWLVGRPLRGPCPRARSWVPPPPGLPQGLQCDIWWAESNLQASMHPDHVVRGWVLKMAQGLGRGSREDSVTQTLLCPRATLQVLHQACEAALGSGLVPGGSALAWASHYQDRLSSDQSCLNEWMAMADLESLRPPSIEPGRSVQGVGVGGCAMAERGRGPWTDGLGSQDLGTGADGGGDPG